MSRAAAFSQCPARTLCWNHLRCVLARWPQRCMLAAEHDDMEIRRKSVPFGRWCPTFAVGSLLRTVPREGGSTHTQAHTVPANFARMLIPQAFGALAFAGLRCFLTRWTSTAATVLPGTAAHQSAPVDPGRSDAAAIGLRAMTSAEGMPPHSSNQGVSVGAAGSSGDGAPAAALALTTHGGKSVNPVICTYRHAALSSACPNPPVECRKGTNGYISAVCEQESHGGCCSHGRSTACMAQLLDTLRTARAVGPVPRLVPRSCGTACFNDFTILVSRLEPRPGAGPGDQGAGATRHGGMSPSHTWTDA